MNSFQMQLKTNAQGHFIVDIPTSIADSAVEVLVVWQTITKPVLNPLPDDVARKQRWLSAFGSCPDLERPEQSSIL